MNLARQRRCRGIASLEFVLILPIFLLLLFGVLEYGWMLAKSGQVINAAREGARVGARADATAADISSAISARMTQAGLQSSGYSTSITPGVDTGSLVTVQITVPYAGNIDLTGFSLIPRPASLNAEVTMSKEGP